MTCKTQTKSLNNPFLCLWYVCTLERYDKAIRKQLYLCLAFVPHLPPLTLPRKRGKKVKLLKSRFNPIAHYLSFRLRNFGPVWLRKSLATRKEPMRLFRMHQKSASSLMHACTCFRATFAYEKSLHGMNLQKFWSELVFERAPVGNSWRKARVHR